MKQIRLETIQFENEIEGQDFVYAKLEWANEFYLQGGTDGLVITKTGSYHTAFVEVFIGEYDETVLDAKLTGDLFIRGEGKTIEQAEKNAWNKMQFSI